MNSDIKKSCKEPIDSLTLTHGHITKKSAFYKKKSVIENIEIEFQRELEGNQLNLEAKENTDVGLLNTRKFHYFLPLIEFEKILFYFFELLLKLTCP